MKKLIVFTVVVSVVTLAGFLGSRKMCAMIQCPMGMPGESFNDKEANDLCSRVCAGRMDVVRLLKEPQVNLKDIDAKIEEVGQSQILLEKKIARRILEEKERMSPEKSQAYLDRIEKSLKATIKRSPNVS